jgi:hypothetical protein
MKAKRKVASNERMKRSLEATRVDIKRWFGARAKSDRLRKVHDLIHVQSVSAHAGVLARELALKKRFSKAAAERVGGRGYLQRQIHKAVAN